MLVPYMTICRVCICASLACCNPLLDAIPAHMHSCFFTLLLHSFLISCQTRIAFISIAAVLIFGYCCQLLYPGTLEGLAMAVLSPLVRYQCDNHLCLCIVPSLRLLTLYSSSSSSPSPPCLGHCLLGLVFHAAKPNVPAAWRQNTQVMSKQVDIGCNFSCVV